MKFHGITEESFAEGEDYDLVIAAISKELFNGAALVVNNLAHDSYAMCSELQHTCIGLDEEVGLCQSITGRSPPGEASKLLLFVENMSIRGNSSGCEAGEASEILWLHS